MPSDDPTDIINSLLDPQSGSSLMSLFDPMPIAISIAVTLACLLVTSRLAAAKGRSGPAWFGWTLVFGPLATIALIVLPRRASKDDEAL